MPAKVVVHIREAVKSPCKGAPERRLLDESLFIATSTGKGTLLHAIWLATIRAKPKARLKKWATSVVPSTVRSYAKRFEPEDPAGRRLRFRALSAKF